ncbi:MAG: exodeoxyribonuclease III [Gracilimonas sp.]|uniref:exodeoxyribonuclease III n=1 Tax=Gracilimonas sp. TaxID=1974203 RepID=UPI0019B13827|nr:exodeoxyribonuclease III [Gracilimonas sp.]MBD3617159.1 exodeoxyribonuclease III [Gracilimonas sp.]
MVKISSYNVNGIRAAHRKGFVNWVEESKPDVICIQELRALETQVPDEVRELDYHEAYHVAEKKGYSGVAIYSKEKPIKVEEGLGVDWIDSEGRVLMAEFESYRVFSVYAPSGTTGDIRQDMKMDFLEKFIRFGTQLREDSKPTVFCGDINICHTEIDIHNPDKQHRTSGFLPEEREWVSEFLNVGYEDVFRNLHPNKTDLYSWWSYRAASKERNKGWRIDYHLATPALAEKARKAEIEMKWDISDHAPVSVIYDL